MTDTVATELPDPQVAAAARSKARTNLATVEPRKVNWWWRPRIARGKVHLLQGDPGVAKSYLTLAWAAANSLWGGLTPEGAPGTTGAAMTLLMQVEDGLADTTVPRLAKLGADLTKIETFGMDDTFVLDPDGITLLAEHLEDVRPSLVIIDPVTFFLGGKVDMHRANEVRQPLAALARLAEQYDCAIILVIHMNKGQAKALYRALGTIDFTAVVRSMLMAGRIEGEPHRGRALFHIKSNIGPEAPPIGYDVVDGGEDDDVGLFQWLPDTDLTIAEVEGRQRGPKPVRAKEATAWLHEQLAAGPRRADEMNRLGYEAGISEATLRRAIRYSVVKEQDAEKVWWWSLLPLARHSDPEVAS